MLDVLHQLLIHDIEHRVVRQGRLLLSLQLCLSDSRSILDVRLDNLRIDDVNGIILSRSATTLSQSCSRVRIVIRLCGSGHARVLVLQHTSLSSFNEVVIQLDRTKAKNLVESHDGLLQVEWLGQVVIGREGDVLVAHIIRCEGLIGKQYKLHLLRDGAHLQLVTQFTTRHAIHVLFTDDQVRMQFLNVGNSLDDIIISMEVVDILKPCHGELDEVFVVVDHEYRELHGRHIHGSP